MPHLKNLFRKSLPRRVYADAAAATPISSAAQDELVRLLAYSGNPSALHEEALAAKKELDHAREVVAKAIGAHADEIVFTGSGTESNNLALTGTLRSLLRGHGELNAVTTVIEHPSVLHPLLSLETDGLYTTQLAVGADGVVSVDDLKEAITDETVLVSIQLVNSEIGTIQPIREIAKEIRRVRQRRSAVPIAPSDPALRQGGQSLIHSASALPLYLHVDASQAPLWLALAVDKLGVDLMTLDAQKVMGPKGIGLLYVRRGVEVEPLLWGGGQESGRRSGTENVALSGAFAVALADAAKNTEKNTETISDVRNFLFTEIKKHVPQVVLNGAPFGDTRIANNLNISIPGLDGEMAVIALSAAGVAASTRSACDSEDEDPSPVLTAIGVTRDMAKSAIRLTLLPTATKKDAAYIAQALTNVVNLYRNT